MNPVGRNDRLGEVIMNKGEGKRSPWDAGDSCDVAEVERKAGRVETKQGR